MDNALALNNGRNLSSGVIPKSRYVIVSLELGRERVVEDFYAFTYKQATFRLKQQQTLIPESEFLLFAYSSLKGWCGDALGYLVVESGKTCIAHKPVVGSERAVMGGERFAESFVGHKYDLTVVCGQADQSAVAYDGVLWARDESVEAVLAQVGRDIDAAIAARK